MRPVSMLIVFLALLSGTYGASKLEDPIFSDGDTLTWFASKARPVRVEIKIAPSGGGVPDIFSEEQVDSTRIPNTLTQVYAIFPRLREMINAVFGQPLKLAGYHHEV